MNGQLSVRQMTMIITSTRRDRRHDYFTVQMREPIERTSYRIDAEQVLHYVRWRATNALRGAPLVATL